MSPMGILGALDRQSGRDQGWRQLFKKTRTNCPYNSDIKTNLHRDKWTDRQTDTNGARK